MAFDLDLWPTTLTYNTNLAKIKVNLHTKYQGCRSNSSAVRRQTDGLTDGRMDARNQVDYLPAPLSYAVDLELFTLD